MAGADAARSRALYKFDVVGAIPPGAIIESARMTLAVSVQIPSGSSASDFGLRRVLVDWGEGSGFGEAPGGRSALAGEATWNQRFHPDMPWSAPGGAFGADFASEDSALAENVDGSRVTPSSYVFEFNATGLADLELMLNGTFPNYGWVLYSYGEGTLRTARRWVSRETINEGPAPKLEITWSNPPAPGAPDLTSVEIDEEAQELVVKLEGRAGLRYQLESGDDLTAWDLGEVHVPTEDGELVFRTALIPPVQFVRVAVSTIP
jgi:hypothetical protein